MGNKFGFGVKVLVVLTALVLIASSMAMYMRQMWEKG